MNNNPNVSVLILNWNRPDLTVDCLRSLRQMDTSMCNLTIYIIDNGSKKSKYLELVRNIKDLGKSNSKIIVIRNKSNLGFAEGNNVGIRKAIDNNCDYLLILNNDTVVDKFLIKNLLSFAKSHQEFGILSPKIYFAKGYEYHKDRYKSNEKGRVIWSAGGSIDWRNIYGKNIGVDKVDSGQFNENYEVDFASGACMFVNAKVIKDVGLFDKKYYMYLEDLEFSVRAKRSGWKVAYIPDAIIWHKVSQSSAIGGDLNDYFISRNRLLFGYKYATLKTKFALFRESVRFLIYGRKWQKLGIKDYYRSRLGSGSWR